MDVGSRFHLLYSAKTRTQNIFEIVGPEIGTNYTKNNELNTIEKSYFQAEIRLENPSSVPYPFFRTRIAFGLESLGPIPRLAASCIKIGHLQLLPSKTVAVARDI